MKRLGSHTVFGIGLVLLSGALYALHFMIFKDPEHIMVFGFGELAFLPIEVLVVTLIIHGMLDAREKRERLEKMNMVVGAFYSELGTELLSLLASADLEIEDARSVLVSRSEWNRRQLAGMRAQLAKHSFDVDIDEVDLAGLRDFLASKRDFLLRLLENPNILEHAQFTDLLFGVFHLAEELKARGVLVDLPRSDLTHLRGDIERAYAAIADQWVAYMQHLHENYPYLFSLALRQNPFDVNASAIVD